MMQLMKVIVELEKRIEKLEELVIKKEQEINDNDISRIKLLIGKHKFGIPKSKIKDRIPSFNYQKIDKILEYLLSIQFIVKKEVTNKANNTSCYKYFLS